MVEAAFLSSRPLVTKARLSRSIKFVLRYLYYVFRTAGKTELLREISEGKRRKCVNTSTTSYSSPPLLADASFHF